MRRLVNSRREEHRRHAAYASGDGVQVLADSARSNIPQRGADEPVEAGVADDVEGPIFRGRAHRAQRNGRGTGTLPTRSLEHHKPAYLSAPEPEQAAGAGPAGYP